MSRSRKVKGKSLKSILHFDTIIYKQIPERDDDVHIITQAGDRLDILSQQFYGTPHYWWFIARVNHLNSMNLKPGLQLRIPITLENAKGF